LFGGLYPLVQDFAQVALVYDYMYVLGVTPMGFSTLGFSSPSTLRYMLCYELGEKSSVVFAHCDDFECIAWLWIRYI